jgi:predicted nucleic acid-binding protein
MIVCLDANIVIYQFSALDSLHFAAAVEHGCTRLLSNDAPLKRFPDVLIEVPS